MSDWNKYDFIRLINLEGRILLILNSNTGCHNLSNAWFTSLNVTVQYCRISITLLMTSLMWLHCCSVDWECRNSDFWCGIQSCGFKILFVSFISIIFPSNFEFVSSKLIDR